MCRLWNDLNGKAEPFLLSWKWHCRKGADVWLQLSTEAEEGEEEEEEALLCLASAGANLGAQRGSTKLQSRCC